MSAPVAKNSEGSSAPGGNVAEGNTIVHGAGSETSEGVDRSSKAAPPPEPEAGDGLVVVDGEVSELTVADGEVKPAAEVESK